LLGRPLISSDEEATAAPVIVIGHFLWQSRFNADPRVIGQAVKLGSTNVTIIGVMPEGFAFPIQERVWAPLRLEPAQGTLCERRGLCGPLFGRLADGVSFGEAQAELDALAQRAAANAPEALRSVRPLLKPYGESYSDPAQTAVIAGIVHSINNRSSAVAAIDPP
jgi:hypothetical protein